MKGSSIHSLQVIKSILYARFSFYDYGSLNVDIVQVDLHFRMQAQLSPLGVGQETELLL